MNELLALDTWLFVVVNTGVTNPLADALFTFVTNKYYLLVFLGLVFPILLWKGGRVGRIFVLVMLLTITLSDRVNSGLLKKLVERPRPCRTLSDVRVLVHCGSGESFPSSHAANIFAAATIATAFYRRFRWYFFSYAGLVALSRVYCGVHYPADILAGAVVGALLALLLLGFWRLGPGRWPPLALPGRQGAHSGGAADSGAA